MARGSRIPTNIIRLQEFSSNPDEIILIEITQIVLIMPIFRKCDDKWVDATGDYDLCMSFDGSRYEFISRRQQNEIWGYRFYSTNWLAERQIR